MPAPVPLSGYWRYGEALSRRTTLAISYSVMPGLVPGIHVLLSVLNNVDGRDKPGHDDAEVGEGTAAIVTCDSRGATSPARRGAKEAGSA
ncbi:hypothetical protein SSBR45G_25860 [Bradyrhizobium sp. SSBR45G]|nr:hypothetical protein SSBR45G_25860 [Bradyrhizobium sp. SSBR45G]GLH84915.1 hypothetical protein SSBR45R_23750 [Bradyrhizobium sp. SSBR45R]